MKDSSFKTWLLDNIQSVLSKPVIPAPFILWCDPAREWKELLRMTCTDAIELWADEDHELLLRHRFAREERRPRIVWIPQKKEALTFFRVFEGEAFLEEQTLLEALREYGVEITRPQEDEVREDLLAFALAKLDDPLNKWKKITPDELISSGMILSVLADAGKPIEERISAERRHLFERRVTADFGFPEPDWTDPDQWRVRTVAHLLATDAAIKLHANDYPASEWIIPHGKSRERAMELLDQWQRDIQLLSRFEELAGKADALLNLQPMMEENSCALADPLASYRGEKALFQKEIEQISRFEGFRELATYLSRKRESYQLHAQGFWGQWTKKKVTWEVLARFGRAARVLLENDGAEKNWHGLKEAFTWYEDDGWQVDMEGEYLTRDWAVEDEGLFSVQKTLRKAFLQILDRTNRVFADFAGQSATWPGKTSLPFAGEALKERLEEKKDRAAVIIADAFRFELGKRLADKINEGQTSPVAFVTPCKAPVPTTTELGMVYALPCSTGGLRVSVDQEKGWSVHAEGFDRNLAVAESRRKWLISCLDIKPSHIMQIKDVGKTGFQLPVAKLVFLFGDELDTQGHEGELAISGAEDYLDRYMQVIHKLRDAGYGRVFLTTDHGYFHHNPEDHEVINKPEGDIRWRTRRAVVGKNLKDETALLTKMADSDLECLTPRSVNAFKTYGGTGFFHRGVTFQEWFIPLVGIQWAKTSKKTGIILKPIAEITTQEPIVEMEPETRGKKNLFGDIVGTYHGRQIRVKVRDVSSGKVLFKSNAVAVSPKDDVIKIRLEKVPGAEGRYGQKLELVVLDSDNEEILATTEVTLKLDLDEWL